jgi:nitrite reductase/ring-hydroxylating ferredoxin subunit
MQNRRSFLSLGLSAIAMLPILKSIPSAVFTKNFTVGKITDIPVKGGKVYTVGGKRVLVTRPKKKQVRAFLAACTHEGQSLSGASANKIVCSRHGAAFDATTGAVLQAPATTPLVKVSVKLNKKNRIIVTIS